MERLKQMKETLINVVQSQLGNPAAADTKELGEAIDMIKDLEEALYYCSVIEAMEDTKKEKEFSKHMKEYESQHYYTPYMRYISPYVEGRDMDWERGKMYYGGRNADGTFAEGNNYGSRSGNGGSSRSYMEGGNGSGRGGYEEYYRYPKELRDCREGRSPLARRGYMEGKEMHRDKTMQMQELEKYMLELSQDITEMIQDASPEEKSILQQKLSTLATKVK